MSYYIKLEGSKNKKKQLKKVAPPVCWQHFAPTLLNGPVSSPAFPPSFPATLVLTSHHHHVTTTLHFYQTQKSSSVDAMGKATRWLKGLFSGKWATTRSTKIKEKVPMVCVGVEEDQNRRAIAVAAATAAVAEAAVAAAQAAAVVVRLTSTGRACGSAAGRRCEVWAAVRIQAAFRSYLARRALKALKGLVKLQALVRGHIIRKQVGEKIRCMQSIVKVQARARASRVLTDNYEDTITLRAGHPTPRKYERSSRGNRTKPERSRTPTRNATRVINASLSLSDHWMDEHCSDSQETTSRLRTLVVDDEKNAKILEVDTGKPYYNSRRRVRYHSMSSDQNSRSFITVPDSPTKDSTTVQHSIPSPSSVDNATSPLQFPLNGQELRQSPHYYTATSLAGSARGGPVTPSKSECSRSVFSSYSGCPNYMAYTESSRAKSRSQSAPKQRPEYDKPWSMKRQSSGQLRSGGSGSGGCQPSSSSQGSTSLHIKLSGKAYPSSGRLDRLGMPIT